MEYQRSDCIDVTEEETKTCITLPEEKILVCKREHKLIPLIACAIILFMASIFTVSGGLLIFLFLESIPLLFSFLLLMGILTLLAVTKIIIDWYFHIYAITTRKIIEIRSVPFFGEYIDDLFLDQVRTTEVDAKIPSFFHELLNMGNVTVGFDRPSHDKVFALFNISKPRQTAMYLSDALEELMKPSQVWFQEGKPNEHVRISEDIFNGRVANA